MTLDIGIVVTIMLVAMVLFATEKLRVDLVALIVMATLLGSGILAPEDGISGFSNTATVTVAAMFILSAGLFRTGAVNVVGAHLAVLAEKNFFLALLTLMIGVGTLSAFINNTAAVAIFMPIVIGVARQIHVSPSKLLMPLSFASMFGGVCTLIGTSTNILASSIVERHGQKPFGMFEFTPLGIIFFGVGILYMFTVGVRWIPTRRTTLDLTQEFGMRKYLTEIVLLPEAKSAGQPLKQSPLVHDLDIDVIEIHREGSPVRVPTPDTILRAHDVLRVRCSVDEIQKMQEREGVILKPHARWRDTELESEHAVLVEAVVAPNSMLVDKSLKEIKFRNVFGATALAIRHRGVVMHENLGVTRLLAGDVLLIEAQRDHLDELKRNPAFVIVSEVGLPHYRRDKIIPALLILTSVVSLAALDIQPIVVTSIIGCVLLILTRCISLEEAYESIQWQVIFLLAGVLTLGLALEKTGAAEVLSQVIISSVGVWGPLALVSTFYLISTLLTNVMSNVATAALLAPIAIVAAESLQLDARPFLMAVTFAASASFMTPVGYQTNTLIYGPGQYRFADFLRVGTPLNLLLWVLSTWLIPVFWPFESTG